MVIFPPYTPLAGSASAMATWIVVGASRGIGLEFVRQLLDQKTYVYATVRDVAKASELWTLAGAAPRANCQLLECDVSSDGSISVRFMRSRNPCTHLNTKS